MSSTGVLVMAYGTASGPDDIERYYTDIRGGRTPSPEHLQELVGRYETIGNRFPLLDTTTKQAEGIVDRLNADAGGAAAYRAYLGMKHSPPFIPEAVAAMREDGVEEAIAIVMAPHWASMSIEGYIQRVEQTIADEGGPQVSFVREWYDHPSFIDFLSSRGRASLDRLPAEAREGAAVLFSAHSLPIQTDDAGRDRCKGCTAHRCQQRCEYHFELQDTADRVAEHLELANEVSIAWQSVGRTADPWWGPSVESVIAQRAADGFPGVVVCCAGVAADHLETLYDLDIEAKDAAEEAGIAFERTEMPNDDPAFLDALADIVRDHIAKGHIVKAT
jgi:ferrochelatase